MLTFIASCFHKVVPSEILESVESKTTTASSKFIYRDDLRKKKSTSKKSSKTPSLKVKDDEKDPKIMRVKVKMTKREAARLLSRCKDGGILAFKDVARELVDLPMNRVTVLSPCPTTNSVFDSIPEEC